MDGTTDPPSTRVLQSDAKLDLAVRIGIEHARAASDRGDLVAAFRRLQELYSDIRDARVAHGPRTRWQRAWFRLNVIAGDHDEAHAVLRTSLEQRRPVADTPAALSELVALLTDLPTDHARHDAIAAAAAVRDSLPLDAAWAATGELLREAERLAASRIKRGPPEARGTRGRAPAGRDAEAS